MLVLAAKNVFKQFDGVRALEGVSFSMDAGERVVVAGPNGAGKSTLLKCLAGILRPDAGTVERNAKSIGVVTEQPYVYRALSVEENLQLFGRLGRVLALTERVETMLHVTRLDNSRAKLVSQLSRGMLQRLALARALLPRPELLIVDEPSTNLDREGCELLAHLLEEHLQYGSLVLATHDLNLMNQFGGRLLTLEQGHLFEERKGSSESTAQLLVGTRG